MIGKLILSHGGLAEELLRTAESIAGPLRGFAALSLSWTDSCEELTRKIEKAVHDLDDGDGVLILADMFGDTPCRIALSMLQPGRYELITGINLPLVVRLACTGVPDDLDELGDWAVEKARGGVRLLRCPNGNTAVGGHGG